MHKLCTRTLIVTVALICCGSLALAQTGSSPKPTSSSDRLFLAFAEDATIVDRQWWEGQVGTADWDDFDVNFVRGVVAFQPWVDLEVGGRIGFGDTDASGSGLDGSGATDLDVWSKYHLGGGDNTEFAVGGVFTVPTGDETAGLGSDAFGVSAFGSLRCRLTKAILTANAGVQFNGDGRRFGETVDRDGETAPMVGAGVILPFSDHFTVVGEVQFRDGRLEGDDDNTQVLGGINWRPGGRGIFRAAIGAGLSDGAPDFQALLGYAAQF
jgi:hypothetical protein